MTNPPRHGEGDRSAQPSGGGGAPRVVPPELARARKLRKSMSLPEVLLWQRLRGSAAGMRFRRQHPIGTYVADFYCAPVRLVVEVDGHIHDDPSRVEFDQTRERFMQENGYRVIRIAARDVLRDVEAVAASVVAYAALPLHHPETGRNERWTS